MLFQMSLEKRPAVMGDPVASGATYSCADGLLNQEHLKLMVAA